MATGFNTQVGNGEYRLQFETDNKEHYLLMQETARRCVDRKIKTNADRIRAMTDAELASCLNLFAGVEEQIKYCQNLPECNTLMETEDGIPEEKCVGCLLGWLQRPAEGDAGGG